MDSVWIEANWFDLAQTIGIGGSLWLAAAAASREAKARELENLLALGDKHREIWQDACKRPELARVLQNDPDVVGAPPTLAEEEFINLVTVHFLTSWRVARAGGLIKAKELGMDAKAFFSLPLPYSVWNRTKALRNPKFVRFITRAISEAHSDKPKEKVV